MVVVHHKAMMERGPSTLDTFRAHIYLPSMSPIFQSHTPSRQLKWQSLGASTDDERSGRNSHEK